MISLGLVFFYYWIILFSIIGYGYLFSKFFLLKSSENNYVGYVGFYGIFSLLLISYLSSFLVPHNLFLIQLLLEVDFFIFGLQNKNFFYQTILKF